MIIICLGTSDALEFSGLISSLILKMVQFQFLVFCCYATHRILRRILK